MRPKKEILKDYTPTDTLLLEVLLDIRDLLKKKKEKEHGAINR